MNPQRLIAAVAALAVGFGVTLVGVGFADDETAAGESEQPQQEQEQEQEQDDDEEEDEPATAVEPLEPAAQDEEPAEEPGAAEVDEPDPPQPETSVQQNPPQEGVPVEPVPTSAPRPTSAPATTSNEPDSGGAYPSFGVQCVQVLRLEYVDGFESVVLIADLGNGEVLVLDDRGESTIDLQSEEDLQDFDTGTRSVEFEDGRPSEYGDFCSIDDERPGGGVGSDADADASIPGDDFPCSERAFEGLSQPLSDLERTELLDDGDVVLTVTAKRLASSGSADEDEWLAALEREFDEFAVFPAGCPDDTESAFVDGGDRFFCAVAQISNDDGLFRFLRDQVSQAMIGCSFENESVQGGN